MVEGLLAGPMVAAVSTITARQEVLRGMEGA